MKIGFFIDDYNPEWFFGTEASLNFFIKGLEGLGHEVYIYTSKVPDLKDENPRIFRFGSIKVIKKPEMYLAFPFFSKNQPEEILRVSNPKLDIVHAHSPFIMGFFGKYIANYQKVPIFYTHHTHFPEYAKIYLKEKIIIPRLTENLIKWFSNQTDRVIVPSFKIEDLLKSYGTRKPISVLPTGVDIDIFKRNPGAGKILRKKLKIDFQKKVLLFVGRMSKEKNPDFLLQAFEEILKKRKDVFLLMVGDGSDLESLKNSAKKMEIDKFIKFTGQVPYKEISSYYQASDLFIFSSLTETQGIVILEAMAAGLPVIVLKDEAFKEIVINNKNGFLIEKPFPQAFAQKVIEILDSSSLYNKFSQFASKTAANFSVENQAKKLLEIYQSGKAI